MELEKSRGISISSTAMTFAYSGFQLNILDTPGHSDFSEDTYRTLAAADNAVMLVDCAKGIEPQTRKLFEVGGGAVVWGGPGAAAGPAEGSRHVSAAAAGRRAGARNSNSTRGGPTLPPSPARPHHTSPS
jgi:hypothetical protein